MLSKSKGQILRISACLHVLFHIDSPLNIPDIISSDAIRAAIDLVSVCIQHAAFLAGQGEIDDIIQDIQKGKMIHVHMLYVRTCIYVRT